MLALGLLCAGCSSSKPPPPEKQRLLLTPPDLKAEHAALIESRTLWDEDGKLLASDIDVAGVVLPRGLTEYRTLEHEWYFKSSRVGVEPIVEFFSERLNVGTVERSAAGAVRLLGAKPKENPGTEFVSLYISPLDSPYDTRVHIRESHDNHYQFSNKLEAELQMKAIQEHAD